MIGVEQWLVFGGSWGSALALAYAASRAEPEDYGYEAAGRAQQHTTSSGWSDRARDEDEDYREPGRGLVPAMRGTPWAA